jgi:hypothetical protein
MAKKSRRKNRGQPAQTKKKSSSRRRKNLNIVPSAQTNEPFEQDRKRRIGNYGGTGEHPIGQ